MFRVGSKAAPAFGPFRFTNVVLDHTRVPVGTLTDFAAIKMLKAWTQRSIHIMVLTCKAVLPTISKGIKFVAPVAVEVEPFCGRIGAGGGCTEFIVIIVICI